MKVSFIKYKPTLFTVYNRGGFETDNNIENLIYEKEPDTKAEEAAEEKEIIPEWNSRAAVSTEVIPPEDVTVEDTQEASEAETKEENPESDHLEEQEQN